MVVREISEESVLHLLGLFYVHPQTWLRGKELWLRPKGLDYGLAKSILTREGYVWTEQEHPIAQLVCIVINLEVS